MEAQRTRHVSYARAVRAVVDTSTLVSLARAGQLTVLDHVPASLVVLDVVVDEAVRDGRAHGHPDAAAIEAALAGRTITPAQAGPTVDGAVLHAATGAGMLLSNDLALGRRARNAGVRWLRTADLVILSHVTGGLDADQARAAVLALGDSGRLTADLTDAYLRELP